MNISQIANIIAASNTDIKFKHSKLLDNEYVLYDFELKEFAFKSVKYFDLIEWFPTLDDLRASDWEIVLTPIDRLK